jgi:hypothetical protein
MSVHREPMMGRGAATVVSFPSAARPVPASRARHCCWAVRSRALKPSLAAARSCMQSVSGSFGFALMLPGAAVSLFSGCVASSGSPTIVTPTITPCAPIAAMAVGRCAGTLDGRRATRRAVPEIKATTGAGLNKGVAPSKPDHTPQDGLLTIVTIAPTTPGAPVTSGRRRCARRSIN